MAHIIFAHNLARL